MFRLCGSNRQSVVRRIVAFHVRAAKNEGFRRSASLSKRVPQPTVDANVCGLSSLGGDSCDEGIPDKGHEEQTNAYQILRRFSRVVRQRRLFNAQWRGAEHVLEPCRLYFSRIGRELDPTIVGERGKQRRRRHSPADAATPSSNRIGRFFCRRSPRRPTSPCRNWRPNWSPPPARRPIPPRRA